MYFAKYFQILIATAFVKYNDNKKNIRVHTVFFRAMLGPQTRP